MKTSITFEIDTEGLSGFTDEYLAQLWHIAQANPAPSGNQDAEYLASKIGFEIIRRWLKGVPPSLYAHQQGTFYWHTLVHGLGAKFIDGRWQIPASSDEVPQ